ncbi:hypothetical protein JKF63_06812 [Porcisia hertigi]|uniref:Uncharacterized protein n=1 Tax=Porcisia hertigi TaxID=2761500 RepID=A0A836LJ60_9TRYP|nr:hypothetical protein JKF63_06812 [Porcisia hertigi]
MAVIQQQGTSSISKVIDYLQLTGRHYCEHVELLRQEQAVREAQHAPFKPNVSLYAKRLSKTSVARQSSSIGARLHELHQKKLALLEEESREQAKRRAAAEAQDCSFSPAVTTRAARSRRSGGDVTAALARWGEQRRARQARAQFEATRNELRMIPATPRVTAYAEEMARAKRGGVSVEALLTAEAEARRRRRYAAFEKAYPSSSSKASRTPERCFSPSISAYASRIEFEEDVVSRLYEPRDINSNGSVTPRHRPYDEGASLHCTFHPKLSAQSAELSRQYYEETGEADTDPYERLFRNTHHPSKFRKPAEPDVVTGKPEINDASRRVVELRRRQLALDGQPRALCHSPSSRLFPGTANSTAVNVRQTCKRKVLTARDVEEQTTLSFTPSVASASDALWRQQVSALKASGMARNSEEARQILWRKAEKRKEEEMMKLRDERRQQEAAECTFRPQAGRPPQRSSGYATMSIEARTALWAQQRERRLANLRAELNKTQDKECSFQPHVDPVFLLPRADAKPAWGVEAFLERQAQARRQREEAEQWWRPQYARAPVTNTLCRPRRCSPPKRAFSLPTQRRSPSASPGTTHSSRLSGAREGEGLEEVFEQNWAHPPASSSLTRSFFSRVSQQGVTPAEYPPSYAVQRPTTLASTCTDAVFYEGPYQWRQVSAAGGSECLGGEDSGRASTSLSRRKPLRYRVAPEAS